jgi:citrate lyase beta subunit
VLITPGDRPERLAKAVTLAADSVAFDLEDGVGPPNKAAARRCIAEALVGLDFGGKERMVRVNAVPTHELGLDLDTLPLSRLDTIFVPKVETAEQMRELSARLEAAELRQNCSSQAEVIVSIETPLGLLNALSIAQACDRVAALFFGSGDYCAATGAAPTERALAVPRALIVAAASAARITAIDAAYFADVVDAEATRADALVAKELGFAGKLVFHPNQIAVCNEVFAPTTAEIARARRILDAWRSAAASGRGTALVDGEFIALDIALAAERTLAVARQAGLVEGEP